MNLLSYIFITKLLAKSNLFKTICNVFSMQSHSYYYLSGLIRLKDHVPTSDDSRKPMSICLPRSKKQPLYAQECAVSFLWSTNDNKQRNKEVDTSAAWFDLEDCSKIKEKDEFGNNSLLQCIQTITDLKPKGKTSQVVYFFTCKMSGYWSVFGLSKNQEHVSKRNKKTFSYFLTLTHYLGWIKKKLYDL